MYHADCIDDIPVEKLSEMFGFELMEAR
jgi:hypothetical protein